MSEDEEKLMKEIEKNGKHKKFYYNYHKKKKGEDISSTDSIEEDINFDMKIVDKHIENMDKEIEIDKTLKEEDKLKKKEKLIKRAKKRLYKKTKINVRNYVELLVYYYLH